LSDAGGASGRRSGRRYAVAALPGDGIGVEVLAAARTVLDAAAARHGFALDWTELDWGCERYLRTGAMMPADGLDVLAGFDAVFLGAVGDPRVPDHVSLWGLLIPIRRRFGQYVNLRPVRLFPGVPSPLAAAGDLDFVVVRENTEGEYSEVGGRHAAGTPEEAAYQLAVFSRTGVERIARYAFELARTRRGSVVAATKSNGIVHTMPFWDEVVREVAADYPDVTLELVHVDALAARFVLAPSTLDVVLGSNLFGDILSDLGAAVAGSIGIAASGNIDPGRRQPSMFEPVHGSAPDIAGRGVANPAGAIWSGALMLEHLGEPAAADDVLAALAGALAEPATRTADLGGTADTAAATAAVRAALSGPPARRS